MLFRLGEDHEPYGYLRTSFSASAPVAPNRSMSPEKFYSFAKEAFRDRSERSLIDSFGHSKRALHAIVDDLLNAYGLIAQNGNVKQFPKKLKMLNDAGVLSLSILRNLNVERNVMEHEYRVPDAKRVEEALDVLDLLIPFSKRKQEDIPYECVAGYLDKSSMHGLLRLDPFEGSISFYQLHPDPKWLHNIAGVEVVGVPIRDHAGHLYPEIRVDRTPIWKHKLCFSALDEWASLLSPLCALQKADRKDLQLVPGFATIQITESHHIPVEDLDSLRSTLDFIDAVFARKNERMASLPASPSESQRVVRICDACAHSKLHPPCGGSTGAH